MASSFSGTHKSKIICSASQPRQEPHCHIQPGLALSSHNQIDEAPPSHVKTQSAPSHCHPSHLYPLNPIYSIPSLSPRHCHSSLINPSSCPTSLTSPILCPKSPHWFHQPPKSRKHRAPRFLLIPQASLVPHEPLLLQAPTCHTNLKVP